MKLTGTTINFLGDSITQGAGASDTEHAYVRVLEKTFGLAMARNYGIGGTRIARRTVPYNPVYDQDFCQRAPDMADDADAVVVFGGVNDFGHGDAPLGAMTDRSPYTFYGACHTLMHLLTRKYLGKPVLFVTPLRCVDEVRTESDGSILALRDFRNVILEVAEFYSLPVLDLYAQSGIRPEIPEVRSALMPDGLHPNDAGHAIVARKIGNYLQLL